MRIFPYYLCRITGLPFNYLRRLEFEHTKSLMAEIGVLEAKIDTLRVSVADHIHSLISKEPEPVLQKKLLNIKRNIYNHRDIKQEEAALLVNKLEEKALAVYKAYTDGCAQLKDLKQEYYRSYTQETGEIRNRFKEICGNRDFQKGLILSSQDLLNNIEAYIKTPQDLFRKKELKTEESLLKYISRMCAKTSPYSTFTNISFGEYGTAGDIAQRAVKSHICLNNNLYGFIKGLLVRVPQIYVLLNVRLNPTIQVNGGQYDFLVNNNNAESFQSIAIGPATEVIYGILKENPHGIVFSELVKSTGEYFDASEEELAFFITELISYGFAEYSLNVSGIDPHWDTKFTAELMPLKEKSALVKDMIGVLTGIRAMAERYGEATVETRKQLLIDAHAITKKICEALKENIPAEALADVAEEAPADEPFKFISPEDFYFKPEKMFFEDTTVNAAPPVTEAESRQLVSALNSWALSMNDMELRQAAKESMCHYFLNKYSAGAQVDIMTFYKDYYSEVRKPIALNNKRTTDSGQAKTDEALPEEVKKAMDLSRSPKTALRQKNNEAWLMSLVDALLKDNTGSEISISKEQLAVKNNNAAPAFHNTFLQVYKEQVNGIEKTMAVMNASFPGHGKFFSRFLHILDGGLTEAFKLWNEATGDVLHIENCDSSMFNVNIHPPLMAYEIRMPGSNNTQPADRQIPVTGLSLVYDSATEALKLRHNDTGKYVSVFDLGLQAVSGRSELFQLLSRFTSQKQIHQDILLNPLNAAIKAKQQDNSGVYFLPRVLIEDTVVIQRKTWIIERHVLPVATAVESDADYFYRVNAWRKALEMPDEVFINLSNGDEMMGLSQEQKARLATDGTKPQYINFNSPVFVNLFRKSLAKVPVALQVQEMLPGSSQLPRINGDNYVAELVVEWQSDE